MPIRKPYTPKTVTPKYPKPPGCVGCSLEHKGQGYVPPAGPTSAEVVLWGEAPWIDEIIQGFPFAGAAGTVLQRSLNFGGWDLATLRRANTIECAPPNMWLAGASWQHDAIQHCRQYTDLVLDAGPKVVVPVGGTALRHLLGLWGHTDIRVEDFHGTVSRDPSDRFWVVPTYHPSHLQRGAMNLFSCVHFDLQRAMDIARDGWVPDTPNLVCDPPLEWFEAWVDQYVAAIRQDPESAWMAVDIETPDSPGKDESEFGKEDSSYTINRVNLCCHPDEAVTVPYEGPYRTLVGRVLAAGGILLMWYKGFDRPRLLKAGHTFGREPWDLMWACHALQSDFPQGLGFWAPFYSRWGPWKHLSWTEPGLYGCGDGLQTYRVGVGGIGELQQSGMLDVFLRHQHEFHQIVLRPAQEVGIRINRTRLTAFHEKLDQHAVRLVGELQQTLPEALRAVYPKQGYVRPPAEGAAHPKSTSVKRDGTAKVNAPDPLKADLFAQSVLIERLILAEVQVCETCGATQVLASHQCSMREDSFAPEPSLKKAVASVRRWFWQEPFNPDSHDQVLAYVQYRKHRPGRTKLTGGDSVDKKTLDRLARTKDPFYRLLLDYRAVTKVRSAYVIRTEQHLDPDDRVHPEPTFKPSTMRLSYTGITIHNVVTDRGGKASLAAGFRTCIIGTQAGEVSETDEPTARVWVQELQTDADCVLMEFDFSGIEAVEVGWLCGDPEYVRLAKLGVHAGLASHILGRPYDKDLLQTDPAQLAAYFKEIKKGEPIVYDRAKRNVHGTAYGLTPYGMIENFPETFPDLKTAQHYQAIYFEMAPGVQAWQHATCQRAAKQHYLGGTDHPYHYKHWFWAVWGFRRISQAELMRRQARGQEVAIIHGNPYAVEPGPDAKRAMAFMPSSIARGVLTEAMFELFASPDHPSYIGHAYFGRTPLRAMIHDSIFLEVPRRYQAWVAEQAFRALMRPIEEQPCPAEWGLGRYLTIGAEGKVGEDWAEMQVLETPTLVELGLEGEAFEVGVSADRTYMVPEESEEDEEQELGTQVLEVKL